MNPPDGVLMHWSRLVDAPLAGLVLLGNALNLNGEAVALSLWPLFVLLGAMAGCVSAAVALGGRGAALPALLMSLTFYQPLAMFLPGSIDHHNVQIAFTLLTLAAALRLREAPVFGVLAGLGVSFMLAIGLETLVFVAIFGMAAALAWGMSGEGARGTAWFGLAFSIAPTALYLLTGASAAATACDSLSWVYALPAALAGAGLATLAALGWHLRGAPVRTLALVMLAVLAGSVFLLVAPECRNGPYGLLSADFNTLILQSVSEAQPLLSTFPRNPAGVIASICAPLLALGISLRRIRASQAEDPVRWALPACLIATAVGLSFYQLRAVPVANAMAMPVLAAWIAELAVRRGVTSLRDLKPAWPVFAAFLIAMPLVHLGLGLAGVRVVALASGGRIVPTGPQAATHDSRLPFSQRECTDAAAAAELSKVPPGLILAPLFYGSSVLALSSHQVVAGPYHRAEAATLDTVYALNAPPDAALRIVRERGVDVLAICASSEEVVATIAEAPRGLMARLVGGDSPEWLEAAAPSPATPLRLYRVRGAATANTQRTDTK